MERTAWEVTVADANVRFTCFADEFVLSAMTRSRSGPVQYGCFGGGCGVCKMKILSGIYRVAKKMSRAHISPAEEEAGFALICCIQPDSDLNIVSATSGE